MACRDNRTTRAQFFKFYHWCLICSRRFLYIYIFLFIWRFYRITINKKYFHIFFYKFHLRAIIYSYYYFGTLTYNQWWNSMQIPIPYLWLLLCFDLDNKFWFSHILRPLNHDFGVFFRNQKLSRIKKKILEKPSK